MQEKLQLKKSESLFNVFIELAGKSSWGTNVVKEYCLSLNNGMKGADIDEKMFTP